MAEIEAGLATMAALALALAGAGERERLADVIGLAEDGVVVEPEPLPPDPIDGESFSGLEGVDRSLGLWSEVAVDGPWISSWSTVGSLRSLFQRFG